MRCRYPHDEQFLGELSNLSVRLYPENDTCIICKGETKILKTSRKECYSFRLGKFTLIEGFSFCGDHKYATANADRILKYPSQLALEIVDRGFRLTIDLVVKVGLLRYRDHRQLEEIRAFLRCCPTNIDLPISTIGLISKRFLEYCKLLHEKYEDMIQEDIQANGGYVAHFDGTTEKKSGVLNFVVMDSLSRHILISEEIESESYESVEKILREVKSKYGYPLTSVSDLKPGFKSASNDAFDSKTPHKFCDYHFLRTFKADFLPNHSFIKSRLTKTWKIASGLRDQLIIVEKLLDGKTISGGKTLADIEKYWAESGNGADTCYLVLRWILRFKQDSSGKGIPFDLPYLDLYERLVQGKELLNTITRSSNGYPKHVYEKLDDLINKMENDVYWSPKFKQAIITLTFMRKWFNKLRGALFLELRRDEQDNLAPLSKRYRLTAREAKAIPGNIEKFLERTRSAISRCHDPAQHKFLTRLHVQTRKYHKNLRLPMLTVAVTGSITTLIPERTNNCLESFFRLIKALLRRNTGRSALTKEFASVGTLLPYYVSMKDHNTFRHIFEDEQKLIHEFALITANKWKLVDNVILFYRDPGDNNFHQDLGDNNPPDLDIVTKAS